MKEVEDFSHGSYGDYSGVVFYGPPTNGFWLDRLAVSSCYVDPLFKAIYDRSWAENSDESVPQLVRDWSTMKGWVDAGIPVKLERLAIVELLDTLAAVREADVTPHCAGSTPDECLRCAAVIRQFLGERLRRGVSVYIENE